MSGETLLLLYASLLLAGLAGSLHCVGMCGPILIGFSQSFRRSGRRSLRLDFAAYHGGRLWTYGLLGFVAGLAGGELRRGSELLGWQRPVALALGAAVVLAGLGLCGLLPGLRLGADGCALTQRWLAPLLREPGLLPRFLLGAVLGLLPCGLVYAMLVAVAPLPTPLHAALGMLVFGLGTLPALGAVLLGSGLLPDWVRSRGTVMVGAVLVLSGGWMVLRALWMG